MTRAIKFRAWDVENKTWARIDLDEWDSSKGPSAAIVPVSANRERKFDGFELQSDKYHIWEQFTGLTDRDGRDIYEGDIVRFKSYTAYKKWWSSLEEKKEIDADFDRQKGSFDVVTGEVKFSGGEFVVEARWHRTIGARHLKNGQRFHTGGTHNGDVEEKDWDFEVIGNVHQNPELLTR